MPVSLVLPFMALLLSAHPLHTTHTDLVESGGQVTVQVRAFSDDLHSAIQKQEHAVDDSALARYVRLAVNLTDVRGRPVPLTWLGQESLGDVTLIRLRGAPAGGLAGARVSQTMHMEVFSDQVNVVQANYGGRRVSLLFVPGDPPKRLP